MQRYLTRRPALAEACHRLTVMSLFAMVHSQEDDAKVCDAAIEPTLAEPARHALLRAMARGIGGDASQATEMMDAIATDDPQTDRVKVTLALAMLVGGNPDWRPVIDRVLALSTDIPAREAATTVVAQVGHLSRTH